MSKLGRFLAAGCVAGLALAPASRAGAAKGKLDLVGSQASANELSLQAQVVNTLDALAARITSSAVYKDHGSQSHGSRTWVPATPPLPSAMQAVTAAKGWAKQLDDKSAALLLGTLHEAMGNIGAPAKVVWVEAGAHPEKATGPGASNAHHADEIVFRLSGGTASFGQPEIRLGLHNAGSMAINLGGWDAPQEGVLLERHHRQSVVLGPNTSGKLGRVVQRLPGHHRASGQRIPK